MIITKTHSVAELIHHDYLLIPVILRFGIKFGFADKSVKEICQEYKINLDFFLAIINAFHDNDYFSDNQLNDFPLQLIVNYLLKSHTHYAEVKIPKIENLIEDLAWEQNSETNKGLLRNFFKQYRDEVITHTAFEENVIYPYITDIEIASKTGVIDEKLAILIKQNTITTYGKDHSDIDSKLLDLKNILIKYLPPSKNVETLSNLLSEIFRFERDLQNHTKIEEKILVPRVSLLEKELLKNI